MNTTKLGELISQEQQRDAIHIAVASVFSNTALKPGDRIGLVKDSFTEVTKNGEHIGIVDPFLTKAVKPGQRFWMLLFPQTITSLKHEWTHPSFIPNSNESKLQESESKKWIQEFAESVGIGYQTLLDGANNWVEHGEYLVLGGLLEGYSVPDEFWIHYENLTQKGVSEDIKTSFFSCSC